MAATPTAPPGAEEFGAWFDAAAAEKACAFFPRYLRHTEGRSAGQPFELQTWQRDDIIRPIFGWKRADGTRLIRTAYVEVAKKNGKTELAAGVSLLALLGDGEFGGQAYSMAVDKDQAKIVFNKATIMVQFSPELGRHLEVFKTSIYCPELMASFKPLATNPESKDGFSPSFVCGDEVHRWKDGALYRIVNESEAAREQPLDFLITTAGIKNRGYGWKMHQRAVAVREGRIVDPTFLPVIYALEPEDDWRDERNWPKANPNLRVSVSLDFLRQKAKEAEESPDKENDFKRYRCNLWTEQATRWLRMVDWRACSRDPADAELWKKLEAELEGRECFGGLDLSSTDDLTALCWSFPPEHEEQPFVQIWRCWVPKRKVELRREAGEVDYQPWIDAGALTAIDKPVIDQRPILKQIKADGERFTIRELAIDRWNSSQISLELSEDGLVVVRHGQGFGDMTEPTKGFEKKVIAGELEHGNNPVAAWAAGNVAVATDPAGNKKPDKEESSEKIDPIVAAIMATGRAALVQPAGTVYDKGAEVMVV